MANGAQSTGSTIGTIVGGILGFFIGGPAGAAYGMTIGGFVGSVIDPAQLADSFGPRIGDLDIQTSSNTATLPRTYGIGAHKGNWIWAKDGKINESASTKTHKQKVLGFTVAKQDVTTYTYSVTGAIAFCELLPGQEIEVVKLWAGDKCIYNASSDDVGNLAGNSALFEAVAKLFEAGALTTRSVIRFHLGAADQLPDEVMQSEIGEGQTPAYRRIFYVMLDEFPLAEFGNSLARAELKCEYTTSFTSSDAELLSEVGLLTSGTDQDQYPLIHNGNYLDQDGLHVWRKGSWDSGLGFSDSQILFHYLYSPTGKGFFLEERDQSVSYGLEYGQWRTMPKGKSDRNVVISTMLFYLASSSGGYGAVPPPELSGMRVILDTSGVGDGFTDLGGRMSSGGSGSLEGDFESFDIALQYLLQQMTGPGVLGYLPGSPNYSQKLNYVYNNNNQVELSDGISWRDGGIGGTPRFTIYYSPEVPSEIPYPIEEDYQTDNIGWITFVIQKYDYELDTFNGGNVAAATHDFKIGFDDEGPLPQKEMHYVYFQDELYFTYQRDGVLNSDKVRYLRKWDAFNEDVGATIVGTDLTLTDMGIMGDRLYLVANDGSEATIYVYDLQLVLQDVLDASEIDAIFGESDSTFYNNVSFDFSKVFYYRSGNLYELYGIDGDEQDLGDVSGELITGDGAPSWFNIWGVGQFLAVTTEGGSMPNLGVQFFTNRVITPGLVNLADIISSECSLVGLEESEIDVLQITDQVRGYTVSSRSTVRAVLDQLRACFPFDAFMSGYQIKFVPRGGSSIRTIPRSDLGGQVLWTQDREMDSQLPQKLVFNYKDIDADFEPNQQYSERFINSANQEILQIPIVFTADEAAQKVDVLHSIRLIERTYFPAFRLPPTYRDSEPSDVVTVELSDTESQEIRLEKVDLQQDQSVVCQATRHAVPIYVSDAVGQGSYPRDDSVGAGGPSFYILVDCAVTDPSDNTPGFNSFMSGIYENWIGGNIWETPDDGGAWNSVVGFSDNCTIGICNGVLTEHGGHLVDVGGSLNVSLYTGQLVDTDIDGLWGEVNLAAYGNIGRWEVIAFQDVVENADGTFTLSRFLRGRRGSEWATGLHEEGDYLIPLVQENVRFIGRSESQINENFVFRGMTIGRPLANAKETDFRYVAENLTPLSPVQASADRDGADNLAASFRARSRLSQCWLQEGLIPVGEETEAYEIDVLDGSSVVRTIEVAVPAFEYTAAQQTTDFGSPQPSIDFEIYQISAAVGRGRVYEVTL